MKSPSKLKKAVFCAVLPIITSCSTYNLVDETSKVNHRLVGWAALDHSARQEGPTSGQFISSNFDVELPFANTQPIPGWSGLLKNDDGTYTALPDNGFGAKGNSADFLLGVYTVGVDFKKHDDDTNRPGKINVLSFLPFNDQHNILKNNKGIDAVITADLNNYYYGKGKGKDSSIPVDDRIKSNRLLTGYDFDVESIVRSSDGSYWVGEEFGPFLLHFDSSGTLIEEPIAHPFLVSPQNPGALDDPQLITHGGSQGFESLSYDGSKELLYVVPESVPLVKSMRPIPEDERVIEIFQFNPQLSSYTGKNFKYRKDGGKIDNEIVIGDMTCVGKDKYILIERDSKFGISAKVKRIYIVDLNIVDKFGVLEKRLLIDLLKINDPINIGGASLGQDNTVFSMPFDSIESLVMFDENVLGVAIDTNYPFEDGRQPGIPDSTEFIQLEFFAPISNYAPAK